MDITSNIDQKITDLLTDRNYINKKTKINNITGLSASHRQYFRIINPSGTSVLCIDSALEEKNIRQYEAVKKFFADLPANIPELIYYNIPNRFQLWEDIGKQSFIDLINRDSCQKDAFVKYTGQFIIPLWMAIWKKSTGSTFPRFSASQYMHEWNFHILNNLTEKYCNLSKSGSEIDRLTAVLTELFSSLDSTVPVAMHRDFQGSNIFLHKNELYLIDFQDMFTGHPLYDPVSWFFDSYINLSNDFRFQQLEKFLQDYGGIWAKDKNQKQISEEGLLLVWHRKMHDAGAFAGAVITKQKTEFKRFIRPAVTMALQAAEKINSLPLINFTGQIFTKIKNDQSTI